MFPSDHTERGVGGRTVLERSRCPQCEKLVCSAQEKDYWSPCERRIVTSGLISHGVTLVELVYV